MSPNNDNDDYEDLSKGATRVTSQSGNDERGTPIEFIRKLMRAVGGKFDLDPCSGAESQPWATNLFNIDDNGLAQKWFGNVYVNPPYSNMKPWMKKAVGEINRTDHNAPELIICLVPGYTSSQWFQRYAAQADLLCLVEGRLTFQGTDNSAPFPSVLLAFGDVTNQVAETFNDIGAIYTRVEVENAAEQARLDDLFGTDGGAITAAGNTGTQNEQIASGSPAPTARDLSRTAAPTAPLDFRSMSVGNELYIELDDTMMGLPDIPTTVSAPVVAGAPATTAKTQTPNEHHTVLCVDDATETYYCLYQDPNNLADLRCTVAPGGNGWTAAYLKTLHRRGVSTGPSAYDYHGTTYINDGTEI